MTSDFLVFSFGCAMGIRSNTICSPFARAVQFLVKATRVKFCLSFSFLPLPILSLNTADRFCTCSLSLSLSLHSLPHRSFDQSRRWFMSFVNILITRAMIINCQWPRSASLVMAVILLLLQPLWIITQSTQKKFCQCFCLVFLCVLPWEPTRSLMLLRHHFTFSSTASCVHWLWKKKNLITVSTLLYFVLPTLPFDGALLFTLTLVFFLSLSVPSIRMRESFTVN